MANVQNLIKNEDLTPKQRRANASKAGKASVKAKREKKAIKEYIETFMERPLENAQVKEKLKNLGMNTDEIDNKMAMVYAQWLEAIRGNTKAFENLLNYSGEKPIEQIQNINPPIINIERPKE